MSPVIGFARGLAAHPEGLPAWELAWLEAPLAARLARLAEVPDWREIERWPAGRVFGEAGEYRWQRRENGLIHGVLLLEAGPLPAPFDGSVELEPVGEPVALVLWGEWVSPEVEGAGNPDGGPLFYAPEIPEIQTYPLDLPKAPGADETPRLLTRRYRDLKGERGEFLRCLGVALLRDEGGGDA
jgi:hypothetical protein